MNGQLAVLEKKDYFKCKNEIPVWKMIYNTFKDEELGEIFTYDEINNRLGFDICKNRGTLYIANKHLLKNEKKMLKNIFNFGYKIAKPDEQIDHAKDRKLKASRQLKWGISELFNIDKSRMTQEELTRRTHLINHFSSSLSIIRKRNIEVMENTEKSLSMQKKTIKQIDNMMKNLVKLKEEVTNNN